MKILFFVPDYYPHIGGVEKHVEKLSRELVAEGYEITVLLQKKDDNHADFEIINSVNVVRINKKFSKTWNRIWLLFYILKNFKKWCDYDILHFHDFGQFWIFALPVIIPLKILNKKCYVTFHGWEGCVPPKKTIIFKRKIVEFLTDGNICIGHFIEKWYGTKSTLISYGGVDKAKDLDSDDDYILYTGRLAPDTGIMNYLKAWEQIQDDYKNMYFKICGDGILLDQLKKYVQLKSIKRVVFEGFVTDIEGQIKNSKIVFCSGYLGIMEAFSYKKAVISVYDNELKKDYLTMIPDYFEMMWVVDDSVQAVSKAIECAIKDNIRRVRGYNFSLNNSWGRVKDEYETLWDIKK